jgi:uncharacterized membrane protein
MSRRRSIIVLLILGLSLALNVFLAGSVVPDVWRGREGRFLRFATRSAIGPVPRSIQERANAALEKDRSAIEQAGNAIREARRGVREAVRANPFDPAALDAAFARLRSASSAFQEVVQHSLAQALAAAPAEERAGVEPRRRRH